MSLQMIRSPDLSRLIVGFLFVVLPSVRGATPSSLEELQNGLAEVAERVRPSVVAIRAERKLDEEDFDRDQVPDDENHRRFRDRLYPAVGTGVILTTEGHILTNEHVVHNALPQDIECILWNGQSYSVQGLTSDPRSDLAVLRIEAPDLRPAQLGDAATVRQGHFAIVMGNPFGSASENYGRTAMSFGIISAMGQDLTQKLDLSQQRYYGNLLQTDARINPGNSGGPLLNLRGEVVGITTAISTRSGRSEGVGYAISVDARVREIIDRLKRGEEVPYGFIGVQLDRPSESQRRSAGAPLSGGALVRDVTSGAPAAGKLQSGDIVVEFDSVLVEDVDQLIRLVGAATVGKDVQVKYYRNHQLLTSTLAPAPRKNLLRGVHIEAPLNWRGMRLADLSDDLRETYKLPDDTSGVVVVHVESGGAASKAGLKPGQVIRQVGDDEVREVRALRRLTPQLTGPVRIKAAGSDTEITLP